MSYGLKEIVQKSDRRVWKFQLLEVLWLKVMKYKFLDSFLI